MYDVFLELLSKNKVSTYKVAKATGISQNTFSDWKSGRSTPKLDKLQKIADYFNVPVNVFFEPEQKEIPAPQESEDDIAVELEEMMKKLESDGTLMFDGNPASPEAVRSIRTDLEMGLRYARDIQKDNEGKDKK